MTHDIGNIGSLEFFQMFPELSKRSLTPRLKREPTGDELAAMMTAFGQMQTLESSESKIDALAALFAHAYENGYNAAHRRMTDEE